MFMNIPCNEGNLNFQKPISLLGPSMIFNVSSLKVATSRCTCFWSDALMVLWCLIKFLIFHHQIPVIHIVHRTLNVILALVFSQMMSHIIHNSALISLDHFHYIWYHPWNSPHSCHSLAHMFLLFRACIWLISVVCVIHIVYRCP